MSLAPPHMSRGELEVETYSVSVAFSPDGKRLASGGWGGTGNILDAQSGEEVLTLRGHSDQVCNVSFGPGSRSPTTDSED